MAVTSQFWQAHVRPKNKNVCFRHLDFLLQISSGKEVIYKKKTNQDRLHDLYTVVTQNTNTSFYGF